MMLWKTMKYGLAGGTIALMSGLALFGTEMWSYARGSVGSVRTAVRESVPVEFEIRRAQDMAEQIVPELRANIRRIAEEEVEVARLEKDITASTQRLAEQRQRLASLRDRLETGQAHFTLHGHHYDRATLIEEVADRFAHYREAQDILAGKQRLLESRHQSLAAAKQALDRTRRQKQRIEQQIASLEAQHRLVESASAGSKMALDDSQLAQTQKLVDRIKKRLDVAERVLAHEARFVQQPVLDQTIDEHELMEEMTAYFDDTDTNRGQSPGGALSQGESASPETVQ